MTPIFPGQSLPAMPGDTFSFSPPNTSAVYRFEAEEVSTLAAPLTVVVRSGSEYGPLVVSGIGSVELVCNQGAVVITVEGAPGPYYLSCSDVSGRWPT